MSISTINTDAATYTAKAQGALYRGLEYVEGKPLFLAFILTVFYVLIVPIRTLRPLWYDELLTYYIAKSSTWEHLVTGIMRIDLNPPLQHVLTHVSLSVFGDSPLATRLPSIGCFFIASMALYYVICKRLSTWYAFWGVLIFWTSPWFEYSYEARPYALMIALFAGAAICWQKSIDGSPRKKALWGLSLCVTGMLLSHCFAVFLILAFGLAELARWWERRQPDYPLWAAIIGPCVPAVFLFHHLSANMQKTAYPADFVTSWTKVYEACSSPFQKTALLMSFGVCAVLALRTFSSKSKQFSPIRLCEVVFLETLLLFPVWIHLLLQQSQAPFWPRYAIGYGFGLAFLFPALLAKFSKRDLLCAATASIVLAVYLFKDPVPDRRSLIIAEFRQEKWSWTPDAWYRRIDPQLPFVCGSGITFVEMNKREPQEFLQRVYYLNDRPLAIQYAHATIFEGLPVLMRYIGGNQKAVPYRDFIRTNRRFLVFGTIPYPEDWLLRALLDTGARVQLVGQGPAGYRDATLFEVTLPENYEIRAQTQ